MLGNLIGGMITIVVGATLMPTIANEVKGAEQNYETSRANSSISGTSATILDLTILFFALAIVSTGIGIATNGLKSAGLV